MGERFAIAPLRAADTAEVTVLYRASAAGRGGLARTPDEIDEAYVRDLLAHAEAAGIVLGARSGATLCAMIDATRIGPRQFAHVLSNLTVIVHPEFQAQGLGTLMFRSLIDAARQLTPRIERLELMVRSGNVDAVRLYERLGFVIEGRFKNRVRLTDGTVEDDLAMALTL